ncbi:flavoprotein [Streptomyces yaizuensis]|uniref:Flavoprotein n=1 Tax=Streptomyces yaizuensis TaxID=2989713 RepID=A0ABQ5P850_9ACTN|nr:flavoprotein [Streptomyces sp. YSPA8]GLF98759.1 flavoprotein [Streptomyces sp. YSPA8]
MTKRVLYLIACAAGPTEYVDTGVREAQAAGWDVCLILTPSAARWWDGRRGELEELTGHLVRSQYKLPSQGDALPKADAMLVAPLSCTSLNKWGAGIADTLAIGLVSEGANMGVPVLAMPYFNRAQGAQPAVKRSIADLRAQGVVYLDGPAGYEPHPPKQGQAQAFPWGRALAAAAAVVPRAATAPGTPGVALGGGRSGTSDLRSP